MAFLQVSFYSQSLLMNTNLSVFLPTPDSDEVLNKKSSDYFRPGIRYQTLYLLHGAYGDCTDWPRLTGIERYAQKHKVAVVMASAANSFYQDMVHGAKYLTYMTEELPRFVSILFPLSTKREDTFIAGLSMGGYGAFRVALEKPQNYACAASLSGALDVVRLLDGRVDSAIPFSDAFGDTTALKDTDADLFALVKKHKARGTDLPRLFQSCGTEDFLYELNQGARDQFRALGTDLTYEEHPGIHDWDYWDRHIQRVLDWLPLTRGTDSV